MNNITRETAARVAATHFGTGRYEYTGHRHGYYCWSAWDAQGREWKFQRDISISGPDDEKCEMVTPILTWEDIESLQELCRQLRHKGAKSDPTRMCGVHIHIGANGHTPQTLRNLANIMASHESLLSAALNLDSSRISQYCQTVNKTFLTRLNNKKPKTMAALADIWYGSHPSNVGRNQHYNQSRYHMLNLHAPSPKARSSSGFSNSTPPRQNARAVSTPDSLRATFSFASPFHRWQKRYAPQAPSHSKTRTPNTQ